MKQKVNPVVAAVLIVVALAVSRAKALAGSRDESKKCPAGINSRLAKAVLPVKLGAASRTGRR